MKIWDFDKDYKRKPNIKIGDLIINAHIDPKITEIILSKINNDTFITDAADNENKVSVIKGANGWQLDYLLKKGGLI